MKTEPKANLARRNFLRALGAGAGVAVAPAALVTEAKADTESNDEKRKARYKAEFRRGENLLPRQPLSELREARPC